MNLVEEYSRKQMKATEAIPKFSIGDTVRVHFRIVEGGKERIQVFEGVVIARNGGESPGATFTVRRVTRVLPKPSPHVISSPSVPPHPPEHVAHTLRDEFVRVVFAGVEVLR